MRNLEVYIIMKCLNKIRPYSLILIEVEQLYVTIPGILLSST
jgi:hypothetical protein